VLHEGRYTIAGALAGDAVFRRATFDGLEVPLERLWAGVDEMG
jgi:hypothetical protein